MQKKTQNEVLPGGENCEQVRAKKISLPGLQWLAPDQDKEAVTMAIIYDPKAMLKKIAPEKKIKKLVSKNLTVKKTALSFVKDIDFIDPKQVAEVALKTVRDYQMRVAKEQVAGGFDSSAGDELEAALIKNPKQLIQRVQNSLVFQISEKIKEKYRGEKFEWLPSDAEEPDPEHQLNYGKIFVIGEHEYEGRDFGTDGCKCGMRILTKDEVLDLE
ncbi:hypothetical protein BdPhPhi1402_gp13 [Bdellovibrio phage phi1402]|uniref:hypothetical protein n=1 Tax=Bdellovibrio phage phi1402 TaxID=1035662 RepID=UPI000211A2CB|nr:hypothetical protein BdPhPhi1402_gp13 [Bdellovibrio phage phi1402]AEG42310.1 hypothetical protein [Bdellovibrio phage phi1402]